MTSESSYAYLYKTILIRPRRVDAVVVVLKQTSLIVWTAPSLGKALSAMNTLKNSTCHERVHILLQY